MFIGWNTPNSIPNWQPAGEPYITDYEKRIHTKWAINIFTNLLFQSDLIFNNIESYKGMHENLRMDMEKYKTKW